MSSGMVSNCCPASEPGFLPPWHSALFIQQSPVETRCSLCKMEASIISMGLCLPGHSLLLRIPMGFLLACLWLFEGSLLLGAICLS